MVLRVPEDFSFNRSLEQCENLPFDRLAECPHERLLSMHPTIDECIQIINRHLMQFSKVPPLCISRFVRGGKTTILKEIFTILKRDGNCFPIIVSFNGNTCLDTSCGTVYDLFLRVLAAVFVDLKRVGPLQINSEKLIDYINKSANGKPVVLIIDELNVLGVPLDAEVENFLKTQFLDVAGRYLVFSTHLLLTFDDARPITLSNAPRILRGQSDRGYKAPSSLPTCLDFSALKELIEDTINARLIDEGANLIMAVPEFTPLEIALVCAVPSLLYAKLCLDFDFTQHFNTKYELLCKDVEIDKNKFYRDFVASLLTGKRTSYLHSFELFTSVGSGGILKWPLVYIKEFCKKMKGYGKFLVELFEHLDIHARRTNHGIDWEITIQIAVYLRCLDALFTNSETNIFNVIPTEDRGEDLYFVTAALPPGINTLDLTYDYIDKLLSSQFQSVKERCISAKGILFMLVPTDSSVEKLDGFVGYVSLLTKKGSISGYQCKAGDAVPINLELPSWIDRAYLFRGIPPTRTRTRQDAWIYLNGTQTKEFVGTSLEDIIPANWPNINLE